MAVNMYSVDKLAVSSHLLLPHSYFPEHLELSKLWDKLRGTGILSGEATLSKLVFQPFRKGSILKGKNLFLDHFKRKEFLPF